ncbi:MAG: PLP-dependent aspartate aminotransferase family protein [Spirochaetaceae bacterium]|jgi:cystathionine gamma-synthase|nr:PLP-dependent aspartate aminotransferase family protein [Spirochaetaceae bacterium]
MVLYNNTIGYNLMTRNLLSIETNCARCSEYFEPRTGALSVPIFQSASFRHPALGESTGFDYSRGINPTRLVLEDTVALIEHGKYGLGFASGMGAVSALIKLFKPGSHIIVSSDLYGGTYRLFSEYYASYGFSFSFVDTSDFSKIEEAAKPETQLLFIETPSNPMMKVSDIERCAQFIHNRGGFLAVDNTFLTPYFQNPLDFGADFVLHSGTKYLEGHNDTLSGFIVHSNDEFKETLRTIQMSEGASLSPFDAFLTLRGIKTLALRMKKHEENAACICSWLKNHKAIEKVFWTGLKEHPQAELSKKQARGHSGMVSFYVKDPDMVPKILRKLKLILFAESLGGVESLITYPVVQTHTAIPQKMREDAGVNECLMRLSLGIEDSADLIFDLEQALGG